MELKTYLRQNDLTISAFAGQIHVTDEAVRRYLKGERLPSRAVMAKIIEVTSGQVLPNDFFGIQPAPARRRRAA